MQTRRDFLKFVTMMGGGAAALELVPRSIQSAYAIDPAPGSTFLDAEHVVILMQENRSFDHAFGTLRGVRGFNDPRAMRLANGNSVFVQADRSGNSYAPWRLDIRDTRITWMGSLPHSRHSQVDAWNEGLHDGWIEAKRSGDKEYAELPLTMGYYTRQDIPFYYALADAFTVCDQHYCSVMTSTSPNRCYFWTGTIRDRQNVDSMVHMRNDEIDYGGLGWKTFPERLQEAGISWKSYQNELTRSVLTGEEDAWLSNFGDNPLEYFSAFNAEACKGYASVATRWITELTSEQERRESELAAEQDPTTAAGLRAGLDAIRNRIAMLKASTSNSGSARYRQLSDAQKALHHAAFVTNAGDPHYHTLAELTFDGEGRKQRMRVPRGDLFHQFRKDVNESKLPTVSWLTAPEKFSDHPTSPWYGAWYVSEVMDILTKNPEVWKKTILILTYDENDGYFDHAPSFVAADPRRPETGGASAGIATGLEYTYREDELRMGVAASDARSGPIGMGFRVPMVVASPWSRGGWVNSQLFDHTSTLMFLEQFVQAKYGKNVREENLSAWRRTVSGNLTSVFRPYDPQEPKLDYVNRDRFVIGIEKARDKEIPSNFRKLTAEQVKEITNAPRRSAMMPQQEEGIRPACALPYELYASGSLNSDGQQYMLRLAAGNEVHKEKSAGAAFNVYLRNLQKSNGDAGARVATYALQAGDAMTLQYPLSIFAELRYVIEVHGPNGFYRDFTGRAGSPLPIGVSLQYEPGDAGLTGNISMRLRNDGAASATVTITDNVYKQEAAMRTVGAGQEISVQLDLTSSHGWYDLTVKTDGADSESRYAGRVETGSSGISDPFMGGIV
jgi:phospholipase C